jgi:AcrR family transcriptional regulator
MDAVISEAVAILDAEGDAGLTFRALAARLGGGVASIYWYVSSREELLERASDHVLGGVLTATEKCSGSADPIDDIRAIAVTLFDAMVDRPWLGAYFMRNTDAQPNALLLYERLGQAVLRLGLAPLATFHATSSVLGFVVGIAADLGQELPAEILDGSVSREEYIKRFADRWRELDPKEFPFLHYVVEEFAVHDDTAQFRAGLDLLLAGLRQQARATGRQ